MMSSLNDSEKEIANKLQELGVIQFGDFTLKSGQKSPVYVDLRLVVSSPTLLRELANLIYSKIEQDEIKADCICGVPYAALPVATCLSVDNNIPMLILRKETKAYGAAKRLEGVAISGQKCLIIEDTVTSGSSVIDVAKTLRNHGLEVADVVVILDRYQGASTELAKRDLRLHSIFSLPAVLHYFCETNQIPESRLDEIVKFLAANQVVANGDSNINAIQKPRFDERSCLLRHPRALMLAGIMKLKKTNLCLSADLSDARAILDLVALVGQDICLLKLHADAIANFSDKFIIELRRCAENMNFMIVEDRKFGETGNTARMQLMDGPTRIASWAHLVTVHGVAGPGTLLGLKELCLDRNIGCLLVCEMSSTDALCNSPDYRTRCVEMAKDHKDIVAGFICQKKLSYDDDSFIYMTPGVNIELKSDGLKQRWRHPSTAIKEDNNDIVIVGRGICEAQDPLAAARAFKDAAWEALLCTD